MKMTSREDTIEQKRRLFTFPEEESSMEEAWMRDRVYGLPSS
jgi:hypothetical protein